VETKGKKREAKVTVLQPRKKMKMPASIKVVRKRGA
jgi:hypothetical protein